MSKSRHAGSLIEMPVGRAARDYATDLVDKAVRVSVRLKGNADEEALHDFRVALRRLRSWLRAYPDFLAVDKPLLRRVRKLASSTGEARDAEVGLEWLATQDGDMTAAQRVGYRWLVKRLTARKQAAYQHIRRTVLKRWRGLEKDLQEALDATPAPDISPEHPSFSEVCALLIQRARDELESQLSQVSGIEDLSAAHRARIYAKRLRYLIEPLQSEVSGASHAVSALKTVQDALGELNDSDVLLAELAQAMEQAGAERGRRLVPLIQSHDTPAKTIAAKLERDELVGLLELVRRVHKRRVGEFAVVEERYLHNRISAALKPVREVERALILMDMRLHDVPGDLVNRYLA